MKTDFLISFMGKIQMKQYGNSSQKKQKTFGNDFHFIILSFLWLDFYNF